MLSMMRGWMSSYLVLILFGLLIASFAVWGVGDIFRSGGTASTVAEVGDRVVTASQLDQQFNNRLAELRRLRGDQLSAADAIEAGLLQEVLDQLIFSTAIEVEARRLGIAVSDEEVRDAVREINVFQDEDGNFDGRLFGEFLRQRNMQEQAFLGLLRSDMVRTRLQGAITAGASVPQTVAENYFRALTETRDAQLISFPLPDLADIETPEEEVLEEAYRDSIAAWTTPELRTAKVALLNPATLARDFEVTEADLLAEYEVRRAEFSASDGRRTIAQVVLGDEEDAQAVVDAFTEGSSLEQAVEAAGLVAPVVSLGSVARDELPVALQDAAFALEPGALSQPVESGLGWHVMQVTDVDAAGTGQAFEDVRDELREDVARRLVLDSIIEISNRMDDALAGGATIEEAARAVGAELFTLEALDISGATADRVVRSDIPHLELVMQEVFSLAEGETGLLRETPEGGYFVATLEQIIPPAPRAFSDVRGRVIRAWKEQERRRMGAETAATLAGRIATGAAAADIAGEVNGTLTNLEDVTRDGRNRGQMPRNLVPALFDLEEPGQTVTGAQGERQFIAVLAGITRDSDPENRPEQFAGLERALDQAVSNELLQQFATALRARHSVSVNPAGIDLIVERAIGGESF